jgi:uncharacterized protein YndB with AHSA1/START domain
MGTLPMQGQVEAVTDAPIDAVWNLVTDITRTGEWSHETMSADWVDGATHAVPGARFKGRNKQGRTRWSRTCEVLAAEPYEFRFRTVPTRLYADSTEWTFTLTAAGTQTQIEQRFQVTKLNPMLSRLLFALIPAHRDRSDALRQDVVRLGAAAAKGAVHS